MPGVNRVALSSGKTLGGLLAALGLASGAALAQTTVIQAGAYVDAAGEIKTGAVVVVTDGLITHVGGDVPSGVSIDAYPGAVLCPGLIDCDAALGVSDGLSERQQAIQPQVNARDAFNRFSGQLQAALAAGVTTFALVPDDQNLVGGRIAVCQTNGADDRPCILTDAGPLKLSLDPASFKEDREPTSRGGAIGLLRDTIVMARTAAEDDPLTAFATGKLTGFFAVPSGADVLAALALAEEFGLRVVPIHTRDARLVAMQLAGVVPGVVVGPLELTTGRREALAPAMFERRGVPVALAGGLPEHSADSLRIAAAVAARAGLSQEAARRAITSVPAELLGVSDHVGAIKEGRRADLVVFSGDPLDLRSRVLAVYVGGQRKYHLEGKVDVYGEKR
jgi:imidazolonepropionase-like amidohydrolase